METFFSRHTKTLDIDEPTRRMLWEKQLVAVHYPENREGKLLDQDNDSCDAASYTGRAAQVMRNLAKLSNDGGYVCAEYHGQEKCLVGKVEPRTKIRPVKGRWGSNSGRGGRTAVLKALPIGKVRMVRPRDHAVILVGRPRHWTLSRWPSARNVIENIVEERQASESLDSLSPDQQEILCSEFMRLPRAEDDELPSLAQLLLPVGRTMRDIDILGVDASGRMIFAQVTRLDLNQALGKLRRMSHYKDETDGHVVLFCHHTKPEYVEKVYVFPIQQAFEQFRSSASGKNWLERALGKINY